MKSIIVLLFVATCSIAFAQKKEFVCPPCSGKCDNQVYDKPGTCSSCNMILVLKSSIQFQNLSVEEFCKRISSNPQSILLDVRTPEEFKGTAMRDTYGHFKNAININVEELEARVHELDKYKDREILVYCSHSVRSPRAAIILNNHGFKKVANLSGGVSTLKINGNACLKKNFIEH